MEVIRSLCRDLKRLTNKNPNLAQWNDAIKIAEKRPELYRFLKNIPYIDSGNISFDDNIKRLKFGGGCKFDSSEGSIIDWAKTIDPQVIDDLGVDYLAGFESLYKILIESVNNHTNPLTYDYKTNHQLIINKDLVVTSCDVNYFLFYAEKFCNTFFSYNKDHTLVINLIFEKLSDKHKYVLEKIQNEHKELLIVLSKTSDNRKSLYANGRFLILAELFNEGAKSITTVDIDCIFIGSVELFHRAMKYNQDSIGLIISPAIQFPWYYTMAGFVYFPRNETILKKLKYLSSLISSLYTNKDKKDYWYSDQNALLIFFIMHEVRVTRVGSEHLRKIWKQVGASSKGLVAPE